MLTAIVNSAESAENLIELLSDSDGNLKAHTKVTFWGTRIVTVEKIGRAIPLKELAQKVLEFSKEASEKDSPKRGM